MPLPARREFLRVAGLNLATASLLGVGQPRATTAAGTPPTLLPPDNEATASFTGTPTKLFTAPRRLTAGGVQFQYFEFGNPQGSPLVFVHGFPDSPSAWAGVVARLADLAQYRVVAPYLRGFGETTVLDTKLLGGQQAALGQDLLTLLDALHIDRFHLAGHDWGARTAYAAAILAPARVRSLLALATPYQPWRGALPPPAQAHGHWYQFYFQVDEAKRALTDQRDAFCQELWRTWCPQWRFTAAEFADAASAWHNPQFMPIVLDSYRTRWGGASGLPAYADIQAKLDAQPKPKIAVPTVYVQGGADACDLLEAAAGQEGYFTGGYDRVVLQGAGHFPHRENPQAVADVLQALLRRTAHG